MNNKRECSKCDSKCCIAWGASGLSFTTADIKKWEDNSADHLLEYVIDNKIWFDPDTKEKLKSCPFLSGNGCTIYPKEGEVDLRPTVCISYPWDKKCLNQILNESIFTDDGYEINIACFKKQ